MSRPSPDEIRVATAALRRDAAIWDQQVDAIGAVGAQAAGLGMTRIEAGMFQIVVDAYRQAQSQVTSRCAEGSQAMASVARTLREVADTYDREEATQVHRLRNLY